MRRKEKFHVEWRIFAHPHRIKVVEHSDGQLAEVVVRRGARQLQSAKARVSGTAANEQVIDFHEIKFMAALLRFEHKDERRILIDVDSIDGVHHDPDSKFAHNHLIPRLLLMNHPGARDKIMPAALFALPKHPKKADANGRKADGGEPAKRGLAKSRRLPVVADNA